MRHISIALFMLLAACGDGTTTTGSAAASGSAKPATSGSAAAKTTASAATTGDAKPADGAAAAPADPLDDAGKIEASCESIKETGGCTEHYALGMGAEVAQKSCEAAGRWKKGEGCTKDGRVAACVTATDRFVYYKGTFAPGNGVKEVSKLCTETLMGKFAEFPKK